jgi:hypothetical protein
VAKRRETAYAFFRKHGGYSVAIGETVSQGKRRTALALRDAEAAAEAAGATFYWEVDDLDSSEWSDEKPPYQQWVCIARTAEGEVFASLCGIDFGRDGDPWSNPYRRIVEAELATELPEVEEYEA